MNDLKTIISSIADELAQEVVTIRRHIHQYPEISFDEYKTADFICETLESWGIPFQKGIATTGVIALIEGTAGEGQTIALRADMDALPIEEKNDVPYASTRPGYMHACGHDAHIAMVLGAERS